MSVPYSSILFSGAGLLATAAAAIVGGLTYYDYNEFKTKRSKLASALDSIDVSKLNNLATDVDAQTKLSEGLEYLSDYMKQASEVTGGGETEDHIDRRQVVFDYNGLRKILAILKRSDLKNNADILQQALKALFLLLKSNTGQQVRCSLASLGGIEILMNIATSTEYAMDVRGEAAMALRRATYFEYFKRSYPTEVPYGSSNYEYVIAQPEDKVKLMVELLGSNDTKLEQGTIGVVTHCAHCYDGAIAMSLAGAVPYMVANLRNRQKEFYVTAIFGLACIVDIPENFARNAELMLQRGTLEAVLGILKNEEREKCTKRVTDVIYASVNFLSLKGIYEPEVLAEKRNMVADLLVSNEDIAVNIFSLIVSLNPDAKRKVFRLRTLLTQKAFCEQYEKIQAIVDKSDKKIQEEKNRKKKQQQQMAQMMAGGMGGMPPMGGMGGMPPMGGMGGMPADALTPEMMQMMMSGMGGMPPMGGMGGMPPMQ